MINFNTAKHISTKQLIAYHWQARDGSIFDKQTGRRIYTDSISALWAKMSLKTRYGAQLVFYRDKIDGYIYFHIGDKFYKTEALIP